MGKAQRLEDLLAELAIYEATVNDWNPAPGGIDHGVPNGPELPGADEFAGEAVVRGAGGGEAAALPDQETTDQETREKRIRMRARCGTGLESRTTG